MKKENKFLESLLKALRTDTEIGPRFIESETIEQEARSCVHAVDLDIAFTPILLPGCTKTEEASHVAYRSENGGGVIKEPYRVLTEDELKLARACFLVARGKEMQPYMDRFLGR